MCGAAGYATLAFAPASWAVIPAIALMALGGLATPSVRAMVSNRGGADTQGEMQGLLSAVEGLTAVGAPLITAALFFGFTAKVLPFTFPGAPFALAAAACILAYILIRHEQSEAGQKAPASEHQAAE